MVAWLLHAYSAVVLVSVIGNWMGSDHEFFRLADRLVDPVLKPLRDRLPLAFGFDWAPVILLVVLRLLAQLFR